MTSTLLNFGYNFFQFTRDSKMEIIQVDKSNLTNEHICCAIGNDAVNSKRADSKKEWMKKCFDEGLVFKKLNVRGKVFIEYTPIENAWKPVTGENYLLINCLWVSGQYKAKGYGKQLLDECIADAMKQEKNGVAVISSAKVKPFLTDKKFYTKHGFETVDTAPPYFELLALKINKAAPSPKFSKNVKEGICSNKKGFTIIYSNQCPFAEEYAGIMIDFVKRNNFEATKIKIKTAEDAQKNSSPFGTFGVFYNGKILTHEILSEKKFEKLIQQIVN